MSKSLSRRLQALHESHKQTLILIQELQNFPNSSKLNPGDSDEQRIELANEIHDSLKEQEDTLEILRQEVDDSTYLENKRRSSSTLDSHHATDHERNADLIAKLEEDIKTARGKFRRAQLQAKRNADAAKRKEREQLFAERKLDHNIPRRQGQEKLTQDELAVNASEDVTRALRRAHDLLQGNLSQSQFAQQTLDESQEALSGLSESYGGTGDLLKNSRSLVGQLVRSNKSDTWYLKSAFYIISVTLAWLVFRRILYGPLWWFLWQPLKLLWWVLLSALSPLKMIGAKDKALVQSTGVKPSNVNAKGFPTKQAGDGFVPSMALPGKGGGWASKPQPTQDNEGDSLVDRIGRKVEEAGNYIVGDSSEEEQLVDETEPPNTKKRMMEYEPEAGHIRDEL